MNWDMNTAIPFFFTPISLYEAKISLFGIYLMAYAHKETNS